MNYACFPVDQARGLGDLHASTFNSVPCELRSIFLNDQQAPEYNPYTAVSKKGQSYFGILIGGFLLVWVHVQASVPVIESPWTKRLFAKHCTGPFLNIF